MMKRRSMVWLLVALLSASMLLASCGQKKEEAKEPATPVSVTEVKKGDLIQTEDIPAIIEAKMVVDIQPKLSGRVETVNVEEGQRVKKGQVLAQLETRELKIQLQQAQAGLVSAKNALAQARSGVKTAEASYINAKNNFQRVEQLYEQQVISQQDYENSKLQYEIAKSSYEAAKQQLAVDPATGYQFMEATVKQAEASVALIRANLDNARITSPISGIVSACLIEPGEMTAGVAFTVIDMDTVIASAKITQKNISRIKVGQEVSLNFASLGNKEGTYKITKLVPSADDSNTYKLEVSIPNPDHSIKPGMSATIKAAVNEVKDVTVVPRDAVVKRSGREIVFVVNKNKVKAVEVVTGEYTDELVEIKKGLKVGDKVVTSGQHLLADGDAVTVRNGGNAK